MTTLADKLGLPNQPAPLLQKAARLGLATSGQLESLAIGRGCWHYEQPDQATVPEVSESSLSNEELAIALLSPAQPYSPNIIRLGAAMLGAEGNDPKRIADLAKAEAAEIGVAYVARAGLQFEPDNPFWPALIEEIKTAAPPRAGVLPHPTRFVSMTGLTRAGIGRIVVWIRPRATVALAHG